jgi:hypothetical protein
MMIFSSFSSCTATRGGGSKAEATALDVSPNQPKMQTDACFCLLLKTASQGGQNVAGGEASMVIGTVSLMGKLFPSRFRHVFSC